MRNITHAVSGGAAYAGLGSYAWHQSPGILATGTLLAMGAATLPDLDQQGSAPARAFGWVTGALAVVVHRVSGGHREETHTAVGDLVCAGVAVAALWAQRFPVVFHLGPFTWATSWGMLCLIGWLSLLLGAGSKALRVLRWHNITREALAVAGGTVLALSGYDARGIALAVLVGTVAHCAGDMLTEHGVAWLAPFTHRPLHLLPKPMRISTGHATERVLILPLLVAWMVAVAWHVVTVPGITS